MADKKVFGMGRIKQLLKMPSAEPMYVLNIISYKNFSAYRWYALLVLPILKLVGGNIQWAGHPSTILHGEAQCQSLLLVRYPTHQAFIRMIVNPYYAAINKLREKGVERFEGAFSEAVSGDGKALQSKENLLVLHFNADNPDAVFEQAEALFAPEGAEPVLSLSQYLALDLMPRPKPSDPNPLTYQRNMFFAVDEVNEALNQAVKQWAAKQGDCVAAVYQRSSEKAFMPGQAIPDYLK